MSKRIIYFGGARGVGKTRACIALGLDAEIGFINGAPEPMSFPWPATRVHPGQRVWPGEYAEDGSALLHDYSNRDAYRSMFGIPLDASLCRVSGDGLSVASTSAVSKSDADPWSVTIDLLRRVQQTVLEKYDYVIHDMQHRETLRSDERAINLATPASTVQERANGAVWGGRAPFHYNEHLEASRQQFWKNSDVFWWNAQSAQQQSNPCPWTPAPAWIKRQIAALSPWYHYFVLGGIPVGYAEFQGKWSALRKHLPDNLANKTFLDVGANAGYNSFAAAAEGAAVTAIESSDIYLQQMDLVRQTGEYKVKTTQRVQCIREPAQCYDLTKDHYDIALLSAVHYHINRSSAAPYRKPRTDCASFDLWPINDSLTVVLEDLLIAAERIYIVTNVDHYLRPDNPFAEADPAWLVRALSILGYRNACVHQGFGRSMIVTANGRA